MLGKCHWVDFQLDQSPHGVECVSKQKPRALHRPEQIREQRETTAFRLREEQRWAASLINAALNLGDFQTRIDFRVDANELFRSLQVGDTFLEIAIAHTVVVFGHSPFAKEAKPYRDRQGVARDADRAAP